MTTPGLAGNVLRRQRPRRKPVQRVEKPLPDFLYSKRLSFHFVEHPTESPGAFFAPNCKRLFRQAIGVRQVAPPDLVGHMVGKFADSRETERQDIQIVVTGLSRLNFAVPARPNQFDIPAGADPLNGPLPGNRRRATPFLLCLRLQHTPARTARAP